MKKKWLLAAVAVLLAATAVGIGLVLLSQKDRPGDTMELLGYSTGRYLETENGMHMIILDSGPVVMSGGDALFNGLHTGDEIRIRHGLIRESYPAGTDVSECVRLQEGTLADIPQQILESLCPMGYVPVDGQGVSKSVYTGQILSADDQGLRMRLDFLMEQELDILIDVHTVCVDRDGLKEGDLVYVECHRNSDGNWIADTVTERFAVTYEYGFANMALVLDADWEFEILPYSQHLSYFGISFWPVGQEGSVQVYYYPEEFGVCGTGLSTETIDWSMGLKATVYTYDGNNQWDFTTVLGLPGTYVMMTENVSAWTQEQMDRAMIYLRNAVLAEGLLWEQAAVDMAKRECGEDCTLRRIRFDSCEGVWNVWLLSGDKEVTLLYSADGTLLYKNDSDTEIAVPEKPVIYLYPETDTEVDVKLFFDGEVTATYPRYGNGWKVVASPDGTLTDLVSGREYYCLFWEGIAKTQYDFTSGFVVAGSDTVAFLEDALLKLGLTDREANEFIIYWAPRMEGNPYNLISFQWEAYTDSAVLEILPKPDTMIRVFMAWKALDEPMEIAPQVLTARERIGFTVVEWGGAEVSE